MSLGGNYFLLNNNFVADRTVLALGQSGLCAGRLYRVIYNFRMSLGGNNFLLNNNFVADRAVFALGQSRLCAGRLYRGIYNFRMSLGGNDFLLNNNFVADRAVLTLGQSRLCAGRLYRGIDNLRMSLGRDFFHPGKYCITIQALCTRLVTGLGAGCSFFFDFNDMLMPCRTYCLGLCFTAIHTSVFHYTCIFARRCCYNNTAFRPPVSLCGNCFLLNKNFITDRAVLALGLSGFFAGCRNSRVNNLRMSLGGNNFLLNKNRIAD